MTREKDPCCEPDSDPATGSCCGPTSRRAFLRQVAAAGALAPAAGAVPLAAGATAQPRGAAASPRTPAGAAYPGRSPIALPRTLSGEQLAQVAFPLGGIGTGTISLGGRGELRDWEIFNRPDKGYRPMYGFAALWARPDGGEPVARILETKHLPPYEGPSGLNWPTAPGMPRLDSCVFHGEYPFARIDFAEPQLPVEVTLEAWNPLVPLDAESSGLPVAVLRYRLRNPGARAVDVSIAWSVDNPATMLGSAPLSQGSAGGDDGRINQPRTGGGVTGLVMTNPKLPDGHARQGSFAVAVLDDGVTVTQVPAWRRFRFEVPLRVFWEDFVEDGALDPARHHPSPADEQMPPQAARIEVGSVCASRRIEAGGEATIVYLLTWHFPNRTPEVCGWHAPAGDEKTVIGNWYTTRFADAWEAATHVASRLPELERESRAFLEAMKSTDLPPVLVEAAIGNLSVLRSNTCFRTADGRFHGFEGCKDKGCCHGTCTHVWNYEGSLAFLYPELSRSVRELELGFATDEEGRMDFRYALPYGKERWGRAAADGQMGVLVKLYLDWRLHGDVDWLRSQWPAAKRALEFSWVPGGWDADRDGVMEGCQHNTYDVEFFGPNPLSGVLYLAGLRACEEMARVVGEPGAARTYRDLFERGSAWIDANLFDGEYYVQRVQGQAPEEIAAGLHTSNTAGDPRDPQNQMGEGCLADQVFGQTMAHVADLGDLLDLEHVRSALDSIFRYNFKRSLEDHVGLQRIYALNDEAGLVICDYGAKPAPAAPFFYDTEVWPGIEYQVAALLFHEGRTEPALEIVRAVRARHDGIRRNPWNEAECGHHYVRSLASWLGVWLLLGFQYHAAEAKIHLEPRLAADPLRGFWCVPSGRGGYVWSQAPGRGKLEVTVERGQLDCAILELAAGGGRAGGRAGGGELRGARVELGSRRVGARVETAGKRARIELSRRVTIGAGETLRVELR